MPIGSAGPYAAMAKASRRRPQSCEHDAGGDEQGEKRPVGRFEIETQRLKPIDRKRARTRSFAAAEARGRRSGRLGNERSIRLMSIVNL
jgi:hypothetical protein